jgi:hypothetical protein
MIKNQNRSKWFGASDTSMIMGNWQTESFKNWWLVKLGINPNNGVRTWAMDCGNIMEIPIIRFIEKIEGKKIKIGKRPYYNFLLRLRCNYDGLRRFEVVEIKTTGKGFKKVPKNYWQQCQVLMYKKRKQMTALYAYRMDEIDYLNPYFPQIDKNRLVRHEVIYDEQFIKKEYLPRLRYLARCLKDKKFPKESEYVQFNDKKSK